MHLISSMLRVESEILCKHLSFGALTTKSFTFYSPLALYVRMGSSVLLDRIELGLSIVSSSDHMLLFPMLVKLYFIFCRLFLSKQTV